MFCEKCGNPVNENDKFCNVCGAKVEEITEVEQVANETEVNEVNKVNEAQPVEANVAENAYNEQQRAYEMDVQNQTYSYVPENNGMVTNEMMMEPPKKANFITKILGKLNGVNKKKLITIGTTVVGVALAVFIGAKAAPYIRNTYNKMTMSSEAYLHQVLKDEVKKASDSLADQLQEVKEFYTGDASVDADVEFKIGNGLKDLMGGQAEEMIGWFNNASVSGKMSKTDSSVGGSLSAKVNGTKIVSATVVADVKNEKGYVSVPELNDTAFCADIEGVGKIMQTIKEIGELIPEEKTVKNLMDKYLGVAIDQIKKVEETTEKLEVGALNQKATLLKVRIDAETALDIGEAILKTARNDQDIKSLISSILSNPIISNYADAPSANEVFANLQEAIDDGLKNINEARKSPNFAKNFGEAIIDIYVNGKGEVIGSALSVNANGNNMDIIFMATAEKGGKFATEVNIANMIMLEGDGKKSGDKVTGEYTISVPNGIEFSFDVEGLDLKKLGKGEFSGKVIIGLGDQIRALSGVSGLSSMNPMAAFASNAKIVIDGKSSLESADVTLSVYNGDELYGSIRAKGKVSHKGSNISIPSNSTQDAESWARGFNPDKILKNLENAGAGKLISQMR